MNKYESVVLISPEVGEERMQELIDQFSEMINKDGKLEKVEKTELKKLQYEIKKFSEAFYVIFTYEAKSEVVTELERNFRIIEDVIKYMTIKRDEK